MVDYSNFDRIAKELSDSDEEDGARDKVHVQKLDKPTAVTILGKNTQPLGDDGGGGSSTSIVFKKAAPRYDRNGADNGDFVWQQTSDEVEIRIKVQDTVKARDVVVDITPDNSLVIKIKGQVFLERPLAYKVWTEDSTLLASEEEKFTKSLQWEMQDDPWRCVLIKVWKHHPHPLIRIWWRRCFQGGTEQEVDVDSIEDRKGSADRSAKAQQAWKEAHEMFLQNRAKERSEQGIE